MNFCKANGKQGKGDSRMFKRHPGKNGIPVSEEFDSSNRVAKVMRDLTTPDAPMRPETRERMMERLYNIQGRGAVAARGGRAPRWRFALIPVVATAIVAVLLVVLLFSSGQKPVRAKWYGRLDEFSGNVEVQKPGGRWQEAKKSELIAVHSVIRSGAKSEAQVAFPDGSRMRITDNSEARIVRLGAKSVTVEHLSGGTYHRINEGSDYVVMNGDVALKAVGAAVNVENRVPGHLEIVTVESAVNVEIGSHQPIKVDQGEVMVVAMAGQKKAEKQPVSRERLEEGRLLTSAKQDALAGNPRGVYEQLDVPIQQEPVSAPKQTQPKLPDKKALAVSLGGTASEAGSSLNWDVSGSAGYDTVVLLRSESSEPVFPSDEIARYSDTSMTSATDDSVQKGNTYQYRVVALKGSETVAYSNTVVLNVPKPEPKLQKASISLVASPSKTGAHLEWSVTGATRFNGFVVERVVEKAPSGSPTAVGSSTSKRIQSQDVFYAYNDASAAPGHTYTYKVGLVVDGAVMAYSSSATVEVPAK